MMTRTRPATAAAFALLAGQGQALDCTLPHVLEVYEQYGSQGTFLIADLDFAEPIWPTVGSGHDDPMTVSMKARQVTAEGLVPVDADSLILHFVCQDWGCGPWDDGTVIVIAEVMDGQYFVTVDPCFSSVFGHTPEVEAGLLICATADTCDYPTLD